MAGTKCLAGVSGAMATVIERHGSAPGTEGQKLYLGADGSCLGTVGGGGLERRVLEDLNELVLRRGAHRVVTYKLGAELGMCCGGRVTMLIEPLSGLLPCLIVGAGHVASNARAAPSCSSKARPLTSPTPGSARAAIRSRAESTSWKLLCILQ